MIVSGYIHLIARLLVKAKKGPQPILDLATLQHATRQECWEQVRSTDVLCTISTIYGNDDFCALIHIQTAHSSIISVLPGEPVEVARPGRAELEAKAAVGEGCRRHRRLATPAPASS